MLSTRPPRHHAWGTMAPRRVLARTRPPRDLGATGIGGRHDRTRSDVWGEHDGTRRAERVADERDPVRVLAAHAQEDVDTLGGEASLHRAAADVVQPDDRARLVSRTADQAGEVQPGHVVSDECRSRVRAVDSELDVA